MKKTDLFLILFFVVGGLTGWFGHNYSIQNQEENHGLQIRQGGYEFINPLVECEVDVGFENNNLKSFKHHIESIIKELKNSSTVSDISVYYRDLNNGPWFGINEDQNFSPQSLLKVPVMIAYFKDAEKDPELFNQQVEFKGLNYINATNFSNEIVLKPGVYTILELIEQMIKYSDNHAFNTLLGNIDFNKISKVHADLGITVLENDTPDDFISVKAYASIFRILYNASYLNRNMSEKALSILSQASFEEGIVGGLPDDIIVAHKYGIREQEDEAIKQLHDCGIIYDKNSPYLLCIMSKGSNYNDLKKSISEISKRTYTEISK